MVINGEHYFTLENSLFGAVKLTENAYLDKYSYSERLLNLMHEEIFHYLMVVDLLKTQ